MTALDILHGITAAISAGTLTAIVIVLRPWVGRASGTLALGALSLPTPTS